ncbi:unnamed protein product [Chrysoparadoxa australica]
MHTLHSLLCLLLLLHPAFSFWSASQLRSPRSPLLGAAIRTVSSIETPPRLPVWPVQNGLIEMFLEFIGLHGLGQWLEDTIGGRVSPMVLDGKGGPFLLLAHHRHSFLPWDPFRVISRLFLPEGFPSHPHVGFQTVTYVIKGSMRHRDSLGVKQEYGPGTVQWLSAGSGIQHEEMWTSEDIEIFQLWVNLPIQHKASQPQVRLYGGESENSLLEVDLEGGKVGTVKVLAGEVDGKRMDIDLQRSPLSILHVQLNPNQRFELPMPTEWTSFCYIRKGSASFGGVGNEVVGRTHKLVWLKNDGEGVSIAAEGAGVDLMLFAGEELNEPVVASGPFVVSDQVQLADAYTRYERGELGKPWDYKASDDEWRRGLGLTTQQD